VNSLRSIAAKASRAGLPFLLAGGHAVIAHGHPRTTFDIDLIIQNADREAWCALAAALGYNFHAKGQNFIQFDAPDSKGMPLDLMLANQDTFSRLAADAAPAGPEIAGIPVVSLHHLLALKCHAIKHGHARRIVKDADDVIRLVQSNRIDLDAPDIRELFLKYGTQELYKKVKAACRP
jgi:hypothetical protein